MPYLIGVFFFMTKRRILSEGDVFNKLTVISETTPHLTKGGELKRKILCRCECGTIKSVWLHSLTTGHAKSCGCLVTKHGESYTSLYGVWASIKDRCYRVNHQAYNRYGGRGIIVCDEWRNDYLKFKAWALSNNYRKGFQIDRIDNNGDYSPFNCRVATPMENSNNRENTTIVVFNGESIPFSMLLRKEGLLHNYAAIKKRIMRGWSIEKSLSTPIKKL